MKPTPLTMALAICTVGVLVWSGVAWFSYAIDGRANSTAQAIALAKQEGARRDADSAAIALAAATVEGRAQLSGIVNKDALSLSNAIAAAGVDAGVDLSIANVTQGPGPALPKGAVLRPASVTFTLQASGSFQRLFTLAELLANLSAASSIDHLQFSHTAGGDTWSMNVDVRAITNNSI